MIRKKKPGFNTLRKGDFAPIHGVIGLQTRVQGLLFTSCGQDHEMHSSRTLKTDLLCRVPGAFMAEWLENPHAIRTCLGITAHLLAQGLDSMSERIRHIAL